MTLWDAFKDMELLTKDIDEFLRSWPFTSGSTEYAYPLVNVWTGEEGAIITSELPGLSLDKINIEISGNKVVLNVEIPERTEEKEKTHYIISELPVGKFTRELAMPFNIDAQKAEAEYKKGILKIKLPKTEKEKPKKIEIKAE